MLSKSPTRELTKQQRGGHKLPSLNTNASAMFQLETARLNIIGDIESLKMKRAALLRGRPRTAPSIPSKISDSSDIHLLPTLRVTSNNVAANGAEILKLDSRTLVERRARHPAAALTSAVSRAGRAVTPRGLRSDAETGKEAHDKYCLPPELLSAAAESITTKRHNEDANSKSVVFVEHMFCLSPGVLSAAAESVMAKRKAKDKARFLEIAADFTTGLLPTERIFPRPETKESHASMFASKLEAEEARDRITPRTNANVHLVASCARKAKAEDDSRDRHRTAPIMNFVAEVSTSSNWDDLRIASQPTTTARFDNSRGHGKSRSALTDAVGPDRVNPRDWKVAVAGSTGGQTSLDWSVDFKAGAEILSQVDLLAAMESATTKYEDGERARWLEIAADYITGHSPAEPNIEANADHFQGFVSDTYLSNAADAAHIASELESSAASSKAADEFNEAQSQVLAALQARETEMRIHQANAATVDLSLLFSDKKAVALARDTAAYNNQDNSKANGAVDLSCLTTSGASKLYSTAGSTEDTNAAANHVEFSFTQVATVRGNAVESCLSTEEISIAADSVITKREAEERVRYLEVSANFTSGLVQTKQTPLKPVMFNSDDVVSDSALSDAADFALIAMEYESKAVWSKAADVFNEVQAQVSVALQARETEMRSARTKATTIDLAVLFPVKAAENHYQGRIQGVDHMENYLHHASPAAAAAETEVNLVEQTTSPSISFIDASFQPKNNWLDDLSLTSLPSVGVVARSWRHDASSLESAAVVAGARRERTFHWTELPRASSLIYRDQQRASTNTGEQPDGACSLQSPIKPSSFHSIVSDYELSDAADARLIAIKLEEQVIWSKAAGELNESQEQVVAALEARATETRKARTKTATVDLEALFPANRYHGHDIVAQNVDTSQTKKGLASAAALVTGVVTVEQNPPASIGTTGASVQSLHTLSKRAEREKGAAEYAARRVDLPEASLTAESCLSNKHDVGHGAPLVVISSVEVARGFYDAASLIGNAETQRARVKPDRSNMHHDSLSPRNVAVDLDEKAPWTKAANEFDESQKIVSATIKARETENRIARSKAATIDLMALFPVKLNEHIHQDRTKGLPQVNRGFPGINHLAAALRHSH